MTKNNAATSYAIGRYIRISSKKVRRVLIRIQGKSYIDALMCLEFMPYKACEIIWQLIYSAGANAFDRFKIVPSCLYISNVQVNKGPIFKRFRIRAKGQQVMLQKSTSHIKILLQRR
jgi:large subunit ribosomal protein L22